MPRMYTFTGPGPPPDPGGEARQRSPASEGHVTMSSRDNLAADLSPSARETRSKIPVRTKSRCEMSNSHSNNRLVMQSRCRSAAELYIGSRIPITPRMSRSGRVVGGTSNVLIPRLLRSPAEEDASTIAYNYLLIPCLVVDTDSKKTRVTLTPYMPVRGRLSGRGSYIPTPVRSHTSTVDGNNFSTLSVRELSRCHETEANSPANKDLPGSGRVRSSRLPVATGNRETQTSRMCKKKTVSSTVPSMSDTITRRHGKGTKIPVQIKKPQVIQSEDAVDPNVEKVRASSNGDVEDAVDPNVEEVRASGSNSDNAHAVDPNEEEVRAFGSYSDNEDAVDPNVEEVRASRNGGENEDAVDPNVEEVRASSNGDYNEDAVDPNVEEVRASSSNSDNEDAEDPNVEEVRASGSNSDNEDAVDPNIEEVRAYSSKSDNEDAVDPNVEEVRASSSNSDNEDAVDPNVGEVRASSCNSDNEDAVDPNVGEVRTSSSNSDNEDAVDPNVEIVRASGSKSDNEDAVDPNVEDVRASGSKTDNEDTVDPNVGEVRASSSKRDNEVAVDPNVEEVRASGSNSDNEDAVDPNVGEVRASSSKRDNEVAVDPNVEEVRASGSNSDNEDAVDPNVEEVRTSGSDSDNEDAVDPNVEDVRASSSKSDNEDAVDPNVGEVRASSSKSDNEDAVDPNVEEVRVSSSKSDNGDAVDPNVGEVRAFSNKSDNEDAVDPNVGEVRASSSKSDNDDAVDPNAEDVRASSSKSDNEDAVDPNVEEVTASSNASDNEDEGDIKDSDVLVEPLVDVSTLSNEAAADVDISQTDIDVKQEKAKYDLQEQVLSKEIELRKKLRNLDEILEMVLKKRSEVDRLTEELREFHVTVDAKDHDESVSVYTQEMKTFRNICFETEIIENKVPFIPQHDIAKMIKEQKLANEDEDGSAEEVKNLLEIIQNTNETRIASLIDNFVMDTKTTHDESDVTKLNDSIDAIIKKYQLSEQPVNHSTELIQRIASPIGEFDLDTYDELRDDTKYLPSLDALNEDDEYTEDVNNEVTITDEVDLNRNVTEPNVSAKQVEEPGFPNMTDDCHIEEKYKTNLTHFDNRNEQGIIHLNGDQPLCQRKPTTIITSRLDISEDLHVMRKELMSEYATIDKRDIVHDIESDITTHEMNLKHAWSKYSDLNGEDEVGNLLAAIQCMRGHAGHGNTIVRHTIDIMIDIFVVGEGVLGIRDSNDTSYVANTVEDKKLSGDINTIERRGDVDYEKPSEDTATSDPRGNRDYEKPSEDTNPTDPRGNRGYEKPGKDTNPKLCPRDNDDYEKPGKGTNPECPRDNDVYEKPGEDTNPTDPGGKRDYEKPDEDTNPTYPGGNDDYEKPCKDTHLNCPRGNDDYEKPGKDTNPTYPSSNDDYEKPCKDTHPNCPRGNDDYEKPSKDTNPTYPSSNDDFEKPCKDTNPKCPRNNDDYEKPGKDTNPTYPRSNDDYEKPCKDTHPKCPRGNDDYEKPGKDTNPTYPSGNRDYEKPGKDTNPTYPSSDDDYEKPCKDTHPNCPRGNDDYEKPSKDTNPTYPSSNDDYEKPCKDTDPTDPRGNRDYEKTGEDTNPTDQSGNREDEKPGKDTNPTYQRCNDDIDGTSEPLKTIYLMYKSRKSAIHPQELKHVDDVSKSLHPTSATVNDVERSTKIRTASPVRGSVRSVYKQNGIPKLRNVTKTAETKDNTLKTSHKPNQKPYSYGPSRHRINGLKEAKPNIVYAGPRIDGTNAKDTKPSKKKQRPKRSSGNIKVIKLDDLPNIRLKKHSSKAEATKQDILDVFTPSQQIPPGRRGADIGSYGTRPRQPSLNPHQLLPSITPVDSIYKDFSQNNTNYRETHNFNTYHWREPNFAANHRTMPSPDFLARPLPTINRYTTNNVDNEQYEDVYKYVYRL